MHQVFNLVVYNVVDRILLQVHTKVSRLAMCMNVNDFVHVNSAYLLHCTRGIESSTIVPTTASMPLYELRALPQLIHGERTMAPPTSCPSLVPLNLLNAADFDVADYLNHQTQINELRFKN